MTVLTLPEVAAMLRLKNERTVRKWCRAGKVPGAFKTSGARGRWRIPSSTVAVLVSRGGDMVENEGNDTLSLDEYLARHGLRRLPCGLHSRINATAEPVVELWVDACIKDGRPEAALIFRLTRADLEIVSAHLGRIELAASLGSMLKGLGLCSTSSGALRDASSMKPSRYMES